MVLTGLASTLAVSTEQLTAFDASLLSSSSPNFPFTAQKYPNMQLDFTSRVEEVDKETAFSEDRWNLPPRKSTDNNESAFCPLPSGIHRKSSFDQPQTTETRPKCRKILILRSPHELRAYRDSLPPVYLHSFHSAQDDAENGQIASSTLQCRRRRISYVPTLGGLHEGHVHLMRNAACLGDEVWVSIFLNPLQFQVSDDYMSYPASFEEDMQTVLKADCVSLVFVPQRAAMLPLDAAPAFSFKSGKNQQRSSEDALPKEKKFRADFTAVENSNKIHPDALHKGDESKHSYDIYTAGESVLPDSVKNELFSKSNADLSFTDLHENNALDSFPEKTHTDTVHDDVVGKGSNTERLSRSRGGQTVKSQSKYVEDSQGRRNPRLFRMRVIFEGIDDVYGEGNRRPGFFSGIGTLMAKMLTLIHPKYLHLGMKDFQQTVCLKRLICGLGLDTLAVVHSTQRDQEDGLCFASRNKRLSSAERKHVAKTYTLLQRICEAYDAGERSVQKLENIGWSYAENNNLDLKYLTFDRWQDGLPVISRHRNNNGNICDKEIALLHVQQPSVWEDKNNTETRLHRLPHQLETERERQQQKHQQHIGETCTCGEKKKNCLGEIQPSMGDRLSMDGREKEKASEGDTENFFLSSSDQTSPSQRMSCVNHEKQFLQKKKFVEADDFLGSPGKYCVTVAVRGNALSTLVDNVTLTDQPRYGDCLPPPLNVPWNRHSAATKYAFFSSFAVLSSLGMHLRFINLEDIPQLLQTERDESMPGQHTAQLLLPLSSMKAQQHQRGPKALIEHQQVGSEQQQPQQQHQQLREREQQQLREGEPQKQSMQKQHQQLNCGQQQLKCERETQQQKQSNHQSPHFDVINYRKVECQKQIHVHMENYREDDDVSLQLQKQHRTYVQEGVGFAEDNMTHSCTTNKTAKASKRILFPWLEPLSFFSEETLSAEKSSAARRCLWRRSFSPATNENKAYFMEKDNDTGISGKSRVRAIGLYKYDLENYSTVHQQQQQQRKAREELIGYVWAEEEVEQSANWKIETGAYADEGQLHTDENGKYEKMEEKGRNLNGVAKTNSEKLLLCVKRVFVLRSWRRRSLGTHLLRCFLAVNYHQMKEENFVISFKRGRKRLHSVLDMSNCFVDLQDVPVFLSGVLQENGFYPVAVPADSTKKVEQQQHLRQKQKWQLKDQCLKFSTCCLRLCLSEWYKRSLLSAQV